MKTCLIIGIDSFTGNYIAEAFVQQGTYKVIGTTRSQCDFKNQHVSKYHKMDLLNYDEISHVIKSTQPDIVIHLAGISFTANDDVSAYYEVHVVGTRNLIRAIEESKATVNKVILASTGQVYGLATNITETTAVAPLNDYAISKLAMEYTAKVWQDKLPIIITRPFNYIGIGQAKRFVIPKIISAFASKAPELVLGRTDVKRDFSDVRFIAQCYLTLAEYGQVGETYNLASGASHSIDYLIDKLTNISGLTIPLRHDEKFMRKNDPDIITVNNNKIMSLNSSLNPLPVEETLKWIFDDENRR